MDPQHIGNGQYLQVISGSEVVFETDTSASGLENCSNSAYALIQADPALKGKVRCALSSAASSLPYSYKAHNTMTATADHVRQSSPYMVRTKTTLLCTTSMANTRAQPKTVVLEDHCGGVPSAEAAGGPQLSQPRTLANQKPEYPDMAKRLGQQGKVVVRVHIDVEGRPSQAAVGQSSGHPLLDKAAVDAVSGWKFVPGRRNGVLEPMWFNVPITYSLN